MMKKDATKTNGACVGRPMFVTDETTDMMTEKDKVSETRVKKKAAPAGKSKKTPNGNAK